jgi:hypothetical protein
MSKELGVLEEHLLKEVKGGYVGQLQKIIENFVIDVNKLNAKYSIKADEKTQEFLYDSFGVNVHQRCLYSKSYRSLYDGTPQKLDEEILNKAAKSFIQEVVSK